jgi:uncharacterized protein
LTWAEVEAIGVGLVAGLLSGTVGIGGGLVYVPSLTTFFGLAQPVAQGTSLVAIVPTALVGGLTHLRQGTVSRAAVAWVAGGGAVGAALGALVAVDIPGSILARLFGLFLLFSAYRIGLAALRPEPPPAPGAAPPP